jgi:ferredoxin-NADP reductase/predicted pyridoxine 5'-phosphate oxidase superfamily flavin-nucleotide-binding protein
MKTTNANQVNDNSSPFHAGEQVIQTRMGVRDQMERFGRRVIRDHMPLQHRDFYQQLPFLFVGHADTEGWPWASILFNKALPQGKVTHNSGFITSKHDKSLEIHTQPVKGDPLGESLNKNTRLGLLGIELTTRRRNRLAAHITEATNKSLSLRVDQAFGNCPQYIQVRELESVDAKTLKTISVEEFTQFDKRAQDLIQNSDTFFVASYVDNGTDAASEGADVSHRGGKPGFIRIDNENTLTIPDYLGNNHFNTFGNFIENDKAGLLFVDFETGHILTLTGTVEILWDSPDVKYFSGAQRLWQFHIKKGRWINNALPFRWKLNEYSPNTELTGTWQEAELLQQAEKQKNDWLPYVVTEIVQESSVIKSFYLKAKGHQVKAFLPGQFLTIKAQINKKELIRTYTVSSAPADEVVRISIKQESSNDHSIPKGVFSNYIHEEIKSGDIIYAKSPTGTFTFDASAERPAVLIAGGIGITPMVSMARHVLIEGIRTRYMRPLTLFCSAKDDKQRAFFDELNEISEKSNGKINVFWALSQIDKNLKAGKDFHQTGRLSKELLQAVLALDDYDFYLCGPSGFMQSLYDVLRELGISDHRINAEEFGPASLKREADVATLPFTPELSASEAIIEFTDSKVEQAWSKNDGNLLEFAESHGFTPEFGCRSGQCGACKTKLISGKVTYQNDAIATIEADEVLLCCALPASEKGQDMTKIAIKL